MEENTRTRTKGASARQHDASYVACIVRVRRRSSFPSGNHASPTISPAGVHRIRSSSSIVCRLKNPRTGSAAPSPNVVATPRSIRSAPTLVDVTAWWIAVATPQHPADRHARRPGERGGTTTLSVRRRRSSFWNAVATRQRHVVATPRAVGAFWKRVALGEDEEAARNGRARQ